VSDPTFLQAASSEDEVSIDAPEISETVNNELAADIVDNDYSGPVDVNVDAVDSPADFDLSAVVEAEIVGDEADAVVASDEEVSETAEESAVDLDDPIEAFRTRLSLQPGEWFVVHTSKGFENRVKQNLETRRVSLGMEDYIFEVAVPTEEVTEIKKDKRQVVKRNKFPGYVLVRMDLTDESWGVVRHTPNITGFVGQGAQSHNPAPLTFDEAFSMLRPPVEKPVATVAAAAASSAAPASGAKGDSTPKIEIDLNVGDSVMVVDGPFATLHASISEIDLGAQRVKAMVEIFGRETSVELGFNQIQKN
jgi:transcriptional antiterminator NusG